MSRGGPRWAIAFRRRAGYHPRMIDVRLRATLVLITMVGLACGKDTGASAEDGASSSGSTGDPTPTEGGEVAGCDVVLRGGQDDAAAVQAALDGAGDDATVCLRGEFAAPGAGFTATGKRGLTLRGVAAAGDDGVGATVDFAAMGDQIGLRFEDVEDLTVEHIAVRNSGGDGIAVFGGERVTIRGVSVGWDAGPSVDNGLFGVYVTGVTDLLVADSVVQGASDAGIWAGESRNVVFSGNTATGNVAGLEAENCQDVEIFGNVAQANTLGLFVLDLPAHASGNGGRVLVHDNTVADNNQANFAAPTALSASVPVGLGVLVLSVDAVELRDNSLRGNDSTGVLVASFKTLALLSMMSIDDPAYDPFPETIEIHDNEFVDNGTQPADLFATFFKQTMMPDITWDGAADASKDNADGHLNLCIRGNGDADFLNLDALNLGANKSSDATPHDCDLAPVAAVDNGLL